MLFYAIKKIVRFAKQVIKSFIAFFLPNFIYRNLICLRFFEMIQIKNNSGTSKLVCVFGIPVLQYANIDGRRKYCLPVKRHIDKTQPVFYLKINRQDDYVFLCFQHWIDTIAEKGADYFIICDNKILEKEICKKIIFHDTNIKFLKSCKNRKSKTIVDKIATRYWIKATYAHLTTFCHAKNNGIASFWNIDADDTLFCMHPETLSNYLKEVETYANTNDIAAFSLDMWRTRTRKQHWSFGITYVNQNIDYFNIFDGIPNSDWQNDFKDIDVAFNLDWFFTYLKHNKNFNIQTFYFDKCYFIHWGKLISDVVSSNICFWESGMLKFPILLDLYKDEKLGLIQIADDCIKFEIEKFSPNYAVLILRNLIYKNLSNLRFYPIELRRLNCIDEKMWNDEVIMGGVITPCNLITGMPTGSAWSVRHENSFSVFSEVQIRGRRKKDVS